MKSRWVTALSLGALVIFACPEPGAAAQPSFPPLQESKAYKQFKKRPVTDHSKLVYLIDRFQDSGVEINYDGQYYKSGFAAVVARAILVTHYRKQTPKEWIMKWCHRSIGGELIHVKFPDGKFLRASEVLFDELKALDQVIAQDKK